MNPPFGMDGGFVLSWMHHQDHQVLLLSALFYGAAGSV